MEKDFDSWNDKKKNIDKYKKRPFFHERDVWFCHLGTNIGFEENGKGGDFLRPLIIIKKFSNEVMWAIFTTHNNRSGKYYYRLLFTKYRKTTAILSQLRLIDSKRLRYKIGSISEFDFKEIKKRITTFLE